MWVNCLGPAKESKIVAHTSGEPVVNSSLIVKVLLPGDQYFTNSGNKSVDKMCSEVHKVNWEEPKTRFDSVSGNLLLGRYIGLNC